MSDRRTVRPLVLVALATALATAACNKPDAAEQLTAANSAAPLPALPATLPLATGTASAPRYAPPVSALPAAQPVRTVRVADRRDDYAYADDAYAFNQALGDAPPDYGFDYGGTEPWAWQGYDNSRVFVEPVDDGYRYYYYRPDADEPYFVRDPDYGYGYDNGALAVIYAASGAVLPFADYGPRLGYASRYLARGEDLYRASRGNERRAVIAANWAARQDAIAASRDRWAAAASRQAGWQAYRARVADQQAQHWAQEAQRRDADAHRFATWHDDGFRGAPPPRAIPAAWQQASWAQDQARYRPAGDRAERTPADQPAPTAQRLATAGGIGLAAGAAGFAAHHYLQGRQQPSAQQFAGARGPGGADPGLREPARAFGEQRAAQQAIGHQRGPIPDAAERRQGPGSASRIDHGPQAAGPQRAGLQNRESAVAARPERGPADGVHIHRGAGGERGFDASRQGARAPDASRAPTGHAEQRSAPRPQAALHQAAPAFRSSTPAVRQAAPAFHPSAPAFHQAPAMHAAPAPMQHAAPAPRPQGGGGGGGGAPHGEGGHHH